MTREETRIKKLCDEASELAADNIEHRDAVKRNVATLKAMAELIKAKSGTVPDAATKELSDATE